MSDYDRDDADIEPIEVGEYPREWRPIETAPKDGTHILIGTFRDPMPIGFGWCGKPARHQPWQAVVHFWDGAGEEGFYLSTGDEGGAPVTGTHWRPLLDPPKGLEMNIETTNDIQPGADWLSGLPSRFPTHGSVLRLRSLFAKIAAASPYDPGETDLDDEQPIRVTVNLGDVRMARRLLR